MNSYKKYILLEFRLLISKLYLTIPSIALIFYLFYGYSILGQTKLQGFNFLRTAGFLAMGLSMLSVIIGITNEKQEKLIHLDEVMDSLPNHLSRHMAKFTAWLLYVFVLCFTFCTFIIIWVIKDGTGLEKYGMSMAGYVFMNFGIPMLSFWLLGYSISRLLNPKIGWPMLLGIWYLSIPFKKGNISIFVQQVMNQFDEEPYGNRALVHYGLDINWGLLSRKLWLLAVALGIYLLIYLLNSSQRNLKKQKSVIIMSIVILMFAGSVPMILIASTSHSQGAIWDENNFNSNNFDDIQSQAWESNKLEFSTAIPEIKSLGLTFMPQRNDILSYNAIITIKNNTDTAVFTLYRTLSVKNIRVNKKVFNNYKREKDWLVFSDLPLGITEIELNVTGKLPIGLGEITDRTLTLTSDSPWYPVPGQWKVFSPLVSSIAVANKLRPEKDFEIHIISQRGNIITNLNSYKGIKFRGRNNGPTIIQGDYESAEINGIHFVAPTQFFNYYKKYVPSFVDILNNEKINLANMIHCTINKEMNERYKQYFMVLLPEMFQLSRSNFKSLGNEAYVSYPEFDGIHKEEETEFYSGLVKLRQPKLTFECFWRNQYSLKSIVQADFLDGLFRTAETGKAENLEAMYNEYLKTQNPTIINELKNLQKIIKAKSQSEKKKIALNVITEWTKEQRGEG